MLKQAISQSFTLQPKEEKVISFSCIVPPQTPVTRGRTRVHLRTGLDISMAIDPSDWDEISVKPHPLMEKVLQAVQNLGFHLHEVDCEYNPRLGHPYPFVQEFEFRPNGKYYGRLDELEVTLRFDGYQLEVLLQIDRKVRGLQSFIEESFGLDERYAHLQIPASDADISIGVLMEQIDSLIQSRL